MAPAAERIVLPRTLDPQALIEALEAEFDRIAPPRIAGAPRATATSSEGRVNELNDPCRTAGGRVMGVVEQRQPDAGPKYLIGRGKLQEVTKLEENRRRARERIHRLEKEIDWFGEQPAASLASIHVNAYVLRQLLGPRLPGPTGPCREATDAVAEAACHSFSQ